MSFLSYNCISRGRPGAKWRSNHNYLMKESRDSSWEAGRMFRFPGYTKDLALYIKGINFNK